MNTRTIINPDTIPIGLIREKLDQVKDPEIPTLSIVELGMVTKLESTTGRNIKVSITPTFAGCPAVDIIKDEVKKKLSELDPASLEVDVNFDVQWTSDMISEKGRDILSKANFALPHKHNGLFDIEVFKNVECPFCHSNKTLLKTTFGPTLCRAIHYCNNCQQSFEQFKPI
ncbi:phenylacetate-CoA oxygenase subunit PaaJ [soil metagenome]